MKRGLLLLTTAALALALSGCGGKPAPETEPSPPPEAPLAWETLTVELSKEGQATQDLLSAVRELPAPLAAALAKHDPIKKYRPVACEPCAINCPYARKQL